MKSEVLNVEEAAMDCEHERAPDGEGPCPDCGMVFVLCRPCSEAGGADRAIYHGEPACPSRDDRDMTYAQRLGWNR